MVRSGSASGIIRKTSSKAKGAKASTNNLIWWIFGVALAVRLITSMCVLGDLTDPSRDHWNFGYETGRVARSIATGQGFANPFDLPSGATAWLAPVYPGILAVFFKLFGVYSAGAAAAILCFNSLAAALTVVPVYFIARKMFGQPTATYAGWAWAFFPYSIYLAANWVWDTTLSVLILTTLLWLTLELDEPKPLPAWIGYGALWGLAALTNPTLLAALPFLLIWLAYRLHRSGHPWVVRMAATSFFCVLIVAPWLARNARVFHRPVFIKDNFWMEVKVGNSLNQVHWWNDDAHPSQNAAELRKIVSGGELAFLAEKKQESLDFLRHHFGFFAWLSLRRFIFMWSGFWSFQLDYLVNEPMDPVNIVFCSTLTLLGLAGARRAIRAGSEMVFPVLAALFSTQSVFYVTHPYFSYRHAVDPVLVLFGAHAAWPRLSLAWSEWTLRKRVAAWAPAALRIALPGFVSRSNVAGLEEPPVPSEQDLADLADDLEAELEPAGVAADGAEEGD